MEDKGKKNKDRKKKTNSVCYHVVDDCGCFVGSYCCDSSDMSNCSFHQCC
jgi:hypothetical protein